MLRWMPHGHDATMATLNHAVTLVGNREHLEDAQRWCRLHWPNTHGATWCSGHPNEEHIVTSSWRMGRIYALTWRFQRLEDAVLFRLTWC